MVKLKLFVEKYFKSLQSNVTQSKTNDTGGSSSSTSSSSFSSNGKSSKLSKSSSFLSRAGHKSSSSRSSLLSMENQDSVFLTILNENFICNCCLEIIKNPVTLLCGHSFCQLCLVDWYLTSSNRICPTCRQEWNGVPKLNQSLKATIKNLIRQHSLVAVVCNDLTSYSDAITKAEEKKIKAFELKCRSTTGVDFSYENERQRRFGEYWVRYTPRRTNTMIYYFLIGILTGLLISTCLFFFVWLLSGWSRAAYSVANISNVGQLRKKYLKSTEYWNVDEVQEWFYSLGPWTTPMASVALNSKIDGPRLLNLNETILEGCPFNVTDVQIRKLLFDSIQVLKSSHVKAANFWDLKNSNRFQFVFFSLFFESFPRLTCLYYYVFEYETSFKPLFLLFNKNFINLNTNDFIQLDNIKKSVLSGGVGVSNDMVDPKEIRKILVYTLKTPYIRLKNLLNILFYDTNRFTCMFISVNCILLTLIDYIFLIDLARSILGFDGERVKYLLKQRLLVNYAKSFTFIASFYLVWNFLPNIFIDIFYIYFLFVRISLNLNSLLNNVKNFFESIAHYFIRPNH